MSGMLVIIEILAMILFAVLFALLCGSICVIADTDNKKRKILTVLCACIYVLGGVFVMVSNAIRSCME